MSCKKCNADQFPLHRAAAANHIECISYLCSKGLLFFFHVIWCVGLVFLLVFVIKGEKIDTRNKDDSTPLHIACFHGHAPVVYFLIQEGKLPPTQHWQSCHNDQKQYDFTHNLYSGANVNCQNAFNTTPLHMAAAGGHEEIIKILLDHGIFHLLQHQLHEEKSMSIEHDNEIYVQQVQVSM
jgi:ankyrin repeat protein